MFKSIASVRPCLLLSSWLVLSTIVASLDCAAQIAWTNQPGLRAIAVTPVGTGKTGFASLSPESTGVRFTNSVAWSRHSTNQILLNGSGVAAGDLDGDGRCDLVFCGLGGGSAIYRNLGDWRFEDITSRSGLDLSTLDATGVVCADVDGDGDLDLILNTVGQGTFIMENRGDARFVPSGVNELLNQHRCGSSIALADVDGDGDLDLYVANYRINTTRDEPHLGLTIGREQDRPRVTGYGNRPITEPDLMHRFKFHYRPTPDGGATVFHDEQGEADGFYLNQGNGRFVQVSFTNGVFLNESGSPLAEPLFDWGLAVMFRDLNGDGAPDIYVCNDFSTPDRIWMNDGTGRFRTMASAAIRQTSLSTMAVDVADLNRDGFDDIFTVDMLSPERWRRLVQINQPNPNMHLFVDVATRPQVTRNTLQLNRGDGTYAEIAQMAGLEASGWSWSSVFLDVDLDGYEDLLVCNGFERDFMNMDAHRQVQAAQARVPRASPPAAKLAPNRLYPRLATANLAFRNLGNLKFAETGAAWGFDLAAVSQGMCLADLDNDGDLDAVINNLNSPAAILRNETGAPRIGVRLKGQSPNTRGIGARLKISGGPVAEQTQEMIAGGRYLSGDEACRVFAAGSRTNRLSIEVRWRSGARSFFTNLVPDHIFEITEADAVRTQPRQESTHRVAVSHFRDVSDMLAHTNRHVLHNDFADQLMLPNSLDSLGPGVSWLDLDGDGWEDLILPAGRGGVMSVYRNTGRGGFVRENLSSMNAPVEQAQTAVLGWRETNGATVLLSGFSSHAGQDSTNRFSAREYHLPSTNGQPGNPFAAANSSTGPMALADVDGDGDLDLFVGGRFVPGRWPEPASSAIFLRDNGRWVRDVGSSNVFSQVGLVSGALFTDIDGDGDDDLVLACEWGAIRIFANEKGRFTRTDWRLAFGHGTPLPLGNISDLSQLTGWWNGVNAGDFDGDGRLDLVAANWGRNTKYERFRGQPLRVYFGDFNGDERVGILESWFDAETGKYTPIHDVWTLSRSMPWLLARFNNYESFARASVEQALGDRAGSARFWEAAWLDSTVFLNRGDHFEVRALPSTAQMTPAFAPCVADFDGDGREDLFLSQNFFGVRAGTSRYDAGRGLLLRGEGQGGFTPVTGQESGLTIYGEQRGAAVCDFDNDGRVDVAIAQAGDQTKLYRNETGRPGLRVRLRGVPGNPQAIGAMLRLKSAQGWGPVREVHAGSGYWSQDSAIHILALPEVVTRLSIRWPGGKISEIAMDGTAAEVSVNQFGEE